jgi:hypothetical protein
MIIRLAMVAAATGVVLWIGWTLPSSQFLNSDEIPTLDQLDTNGACGDPKPDSRQSPKGRKADRHTHQCPEQSI